MGRGSATASDILYGHLDPRSQRLTQMDKLNESELAEKFDTTLFYEDRGSFSGGRFWGAQTEHIPASWLERGRLVRDQENPELADYQTDTFFHTLTVKHIDYRGKRQELRTHFYKADDEHIQVVSEDGQHQYLISRLELAAVEYLNDYRGRWALCTTADYAARYALCYLDVQTDKIIGYHAEPIEATRHN